jgi:hypothetical protein
MDVLDFSPRPDLTAEDLPAGQEWDTYVISTSSMLNEESLLGLEFHQEFVKSRDVMM